MAGIDRDTLRGIIRNEVETCLSEGGDLATQRAENIKYYFGEKFGNEQEGRSEVVSTDVQDTIEWILPDLIRIFTSGEDSVQFAPVGPEDIEVAEQATEYVNFIWNQDNPGFLNFYTWFKDALLSKNGFIKIWWEESDEVERDTYEGLTDDEFGDVTLESEILEHTPGEGTHDVTVSRASKKGRVKIVPVPPEEYIISVEARSQQDAKLVGHRRRRRRSDLIEEGFDPEIVDMIPSESEFDYSQEEQARNVFLDRTRDISGSDDRAMDPIWVTECYIKADTDGDGIAELRQVTVAGPGYDILEDNPWDGPVPFASITPIIMPHRFYGLAVADLIRDIQLIKSTILRQYLDGLYLANNPRQEVVESDIIDPSEVMTSKPGGVVRVKQKGALTPINVPFVGETALAGMEYIDQLRENRTGVSPRTQGLSENPMHDTAQGQQLMHNMAQGKVELIARIFAETGVKEAFKLILWNITKYQDEERVVRLRNDWVPMDPSNWNPKMDVEVSVGLGTGDKQQQLAYASNLLEIQKLAFEFGFARPEHLLNTAEIIVNAMGFKGVDRFFAVEKAEEEAQMGPDGQPLGPDGQPQMSPEQMAMQAQQMQMQQMAEQQMAMEQAKVQAEMQAKAQKAQMDFQIKQMELEAKKQQEAERLTQEMQLKREEIMMKDALERDKMERELEMKRQQLIEEIQMEKELKSEEMALKRDVGSVTPGGAPG